MCDTLCSLNRCILFSVFYVLPFGVINDDDDDFVVWRSVVCVNYKYSEIIIYNFYHIVLKVINLLLLFYCITLKGSAIKISGYMPTVENYRLTGNR